MSQHFVYVICYRCIFLMEAIEVILIIQMHIYVFENVENGVCIYAFMIIVYLVS